MSTPNPTFAFFGTPDIAVYALEKMETFGFLPSLVVCNPDALVGRKHILTPPETKVWAEARTIPVFQPEALKEKEALTPLTDTAWDFFVVFAYGKILPAWLLEIPKYGTINAHPSLLPKLRGASPVRSTLLSDLSAAGVTIIQMDAELDHGPILCQEPIPLTEPIPGKKLDEIAGKMSGDLLVYALEEIPKRSLAPTPQNHSEATFSKKITKEMGELTLDPQNLPEGFEALEAYKKYCAFDGWPGVFFFTENGMRVKITKAVYEQSTFIPERVIPEGGKEIPFEIFKNKKL